MILNSLIIAVVISTIYVFLRFIVGPFIEKKALRLEAQETEEEEGNTADDEVYYLNIKELRKILRPAMTEAELNFHSRRISVSSALRAINTLHLAPARIEAWSKNTPVPKDDDVIIFPGSHIPTPTHMVDSVGEWSVPTIQSAKQGDIRCITPIGCDIFEGSLVAVTFQDSRHAGKFPPGVLRTLHIL